MLHPVAGQYPTAVILPISVILYNIWWSFCKVSKGGVENVQYATIIKERGEEAHIRSAVQSLPQWWRHDSRRCATHCACMKAPVQIGAKLDLFHCFRPNFKKRTVENFSPNQWVLLSFIFFLFCTSFVVFLVKKNGSFVLQIVQFPRTWCSNHFVSYPENQILHVSKFFNHFRGNTKLQKWEKEKKERREPRTSNGRKTKNQCDLSFCIPAPFCFLPYWYTCVL